MSEHPASSAENDAQQVSSAIYSLYKKQYDGDLMGFACFITDGVGGSNLITSRNITRTELNSAIMEIQKKLREME